MMSERSNGCPGSKAPPQGAMQRQALALPCGVNKTVIAMAEATPTAAVASSDNYVRKKFMTFKHWTKYLTECILTAN